MSSREVATLASKDERTIRRWAKSGKLPAEMVLNKFNSPEYFFGLNDLTPDLQDKMRSAMCDHLRYGNREKRQGHVVSIDACLEAGRTLYDLLPGSSGADEQAVFEMLMCSLASGLTGTEKAVLRLTTEGYGKGEIASKMGIPPQRVNDSLAVLRRRCIEERIVEAV